MKVVKQKKEVVVESKIEEVSGEGLESLLGKDVCVFAADGYIWHGSLTGVNTNDIRLSNAGIVFETGDWNNGKKFTDRMGVPVPHVYIRTAQIITYFESPKS